MGKNLDGLVSTILKFKSSVKEELDKNNCDFHTALNQDEPLSFYGLGSNVDERNPYFVDTSDVLFWHDPIAYVDELERWENKNISNRHEQMRDFLYESGQENAFHRLVQAIKRKRVAPFVGAGLASPCGYPLWRAVLIDLTVKLESISKSEVKAGNHPLADFEKIRAYIAKSKYMDAAQLMYDNCEVHLQKYILDKFDGAPRANINGAIELLPQLTDGCIITTNFDGLIERVFQDHNKPIEGYMHGIQSNNQFAARLIQGDHCILKLHGHFNSYDTYIFSKDQYDQAYGKDGLDYTKPLSKVLRQIFVSHSLLFLGCSMEGDRTLDLFRDVVSSKSFDIPEHFALLPDPNDEAKKYSKENSLTSTKITSLWYKVVIDNDDKENHSQLTRLLLLALDCAAGRVMI